MLVRSLVFGLIPCVRMDHQSFRDHLPIQPHLKLLVLFCAVITAMASSQETARIPLELIQRFILYFTPEDFSKVQ